MKREMKYPETNTFHYHNQNPKNRITSDCAARAISLGTGISYNDFVKDMAQIMIETGYEFGDKKSIEIFLRDCGWKKMKQPKKSDNTKYTGAEFCKIIKQDCIAMIGGHHITCIKNGKIWDIWDCSGGCIGNYWIKEGR